jgi:hypothetical protein
VSRCWSHWIVCACAWAIVGLGSPRPARADAADELDIAVLTFGPGDHPFSKFGHSAILVDDHARGTRLVYNYGTFSFDSAWLIPKFLMGKYRYWLSVQRLEPTLAVYAAENRSVTASHLRLSAAQKQQVVDFLAWNARDENKYYVFDYYRDNCATRVRDIVDRATGGALAAASRAPAAMTWREHTQRLTAHAPWVYAGLHVTMGPLIDQPITQWEEMFLPAELAEGLGRAGLTEVGGFTALVPSRRPPADRAPPRFTARIFGVAACAGALLAALGYGARYRRKLARARLSAYACGLGFALGSLGALFVFLWAFTNHAVAYRNENILQCSPLALWLVPAGLRYALGRRDAARSLFRRTLLVWSSAALGAALTASPLGRQSNAEVIALALPLWSGLALAMYWASRAESDQRGAAQISPTKGPVQYFGSPKV